MASLFGRMLRSADKALVKASRGSIGNYVVNAPPEYGQPMQTQGDSAGVISPVRMREIVEKTPTAAACLNVILDFAVGVPIDVRHIDPAKKAPQTVVDLVRMFLRDPNDQQTARRFKDALLRDLTTFGYAAVEIEPNASGGVANLNVLDAERMGLDHDEHGKILGYDMISARGMPIHGPDGQHAWEPDEVIWFVRDEKSRNRSGISRIQQLFALGVLESLVLTFIGHRFTEGNIPYGVLDLGELSNDELDFAINTWNEQLQKSGEHRIIFTNSRSGSNWYPFAYGLKELEAKELLDRIRGMIMGILGVTMNEMGESQDVNKSNGYNLSFTFKKRAVEPLLTEMCETLTKFLLHKRLGYQQVELFFSEIDSRDELLESQIEDVLMKLGVLSLNQVRNKKGMPSVVGGDECMLFNGREWIPLSLIRPMAEAQLQSLWLVNAQMMAEILNPQPAGDGTGQAQVKPPRVLGTALPAMPGMPGSVGNPGATIRLPQPESASPQGQTQNVKRARGPVQAGRNAGIRKEDMA